MVTLLITFSLVPSVIAPFWQTGKSIRNKHPQPLTFNKLGCTAVQVLILALGLSESAWGDYL